MSEHHLLENISFPHDFRALPPEKLPQLAAELRAELIDAVSLTGGHLGAGLGVVELTVALHYVFNTPEDVLIWDVGHQAYPHKILTGRKDRIRSIRQPGGLSGFTKRGESEYDPFGAAHSSTSISSALGFAVGRDLALKASSPLRGEGRGEGRDEQPPHPSPLPGGERGHEVIAVIGDGAMSAGMAYEAMNNAGALGKRLIVILNDNDMSIAPPVGAMSAYLSRLISSHSYRNLREVAKTVAGKFPEPLARAAKKMERYARGMATGGTLFEEMGFYYIGPIDGHNLDHLIPVLKNVHEEKDSGPVFIHVVTQKGKGYEPAEISADRYHGVTSFNIATGEQKKSGAGAPSYTKVFAQSLVKQAEKDDKIVAITAAMPSGTGLDAFAEAFPDRCFDVGIAEQHAVTFAAGLACEGFKPFCAIYSTFLQRGYDQVVHDVAIQKLPVRFAMDRAGQVGADGPTHAGSFDIAYLGCLPGFVLMAPSDELELMHMIATAAEIDDRPSALRYPRGEGTGAVLPKIGTALEIGKGRIVREGAQVAILSYGTRLVEALKAAEELDQRGISATVADARFCKPLDTELVSRLAREHEVLITVEEGSVGGFGSHVGHFLAHQGLLDRGLKFRPLCFADAFIEQNAQSVQNDEAGVNAAQMVEAVVLALGKSGIRAVG